jgi:hypothetical protein
MIPRDAHAPTSSGRSPLKPLIPAPIGIRFHDTQTPARAYACAGQATAAWRVNRVPWVAR